MARNLTVTVAGTALLFFFTLAYALSPLDLPENGVARNDDSFVDLTESDPKSTPSIILPSEKPESEPLKVADLELEETETIESKIPTAIEKPEPNSDNDLVMPLTVVTFRPVNRHFPRRPLIPFRRGHRCHGRHHHHQHHNNFKPWGPQEVSYGNDMILSGGKDLDFDPVSRGGDREMPARWTRFNHGGHRFSLINDESRTEEMNEKPHHHHLHFRHHHDHEEEVEEKRHDHDHDHDHGFMKGIRKFLNHF